jgi:hypothetical protein
MSRGATVVVSRGANAEAGAIQFAQDLGEPADGGTPLSANSAPRTIGGRKTSGSAPKPAARADDR